MVTDKRFGSHIYMSTDWDWKQFLENEFLCRVLSTRTSKERWCLEGTELKVKDKKDSLWMHTVKCFKLYTWHFISITLPLSDYKQYKNAKQPSGQKHLFRPRPLTMITTATVQCTIQEDLWSGFSVPALLALLLWGGATVMCNNLMNRHKSEAISHLYLTGHSLEMLSMWIKNEIDLSYIN